LGHLVSEHLMTLFQKTPQSYRLGSRTLPGRYFTSTEILAAETERIFLREWLCAGHVGRIPAVGDYFLVEAFGESIIVLRGPDEQVRAFYNVCRHRGTRLCEQPEGRLARSIQCPYHAWTYALDGTLIGADDERSIGFQEGGPPAAYRPAAHLGGFHLHQPGQVTPPI
jgi:Rieske 2Fe-2S family protein